MYKLPMLSSRMPLGPLNDIAAIVSATNEPGAKRCTRLLPASMIYMKLFVSNVIAVGEFNVVAVAPETLVTPAIVEP